MDDPQEVWFVKSPKSFLGASGLKPQLAVRDRLVERWLRSNRAQLSQETRQVYYLSMEFLIGRTLSNAL
ncbi:hypothetical protein MJM45_31060, partial [Salmonella enterica subsp. enterica serovar Kentucky]|nr:hypothetical protein [Salmonella enterica subsp. enterica serovar Kentucky]